MSQVIEANCPILSNPPWKGGKAKYRLGLKPINLDDFKNKKLFALAGIGNPENFFQLIEENNLKIHIVADKSINAFVTNGQNMFLNTGLIIKAGSASGLIGVIAHEIGHIKAGHIIKMKQKARQLQDNQFITSLLGMGLLIATCRLVNILMMIRF